MRQDTVCGYCYAVGMMIVTGSESGAIGTGRTQLQPGSSRRMRASARALTLLVMLVMTSPAPAFVFDTFGDGFWNDNSLVVSAAGAGQAVAGSTTEQQQFELLCNLDKATLRIGAHDSWLCIGALAGAGTNGTPVVTINYTAAASQQWNLVDVGGGNYRIVNASSGLALQTDGGSPAQVTLASVAANPQQYWHFSYQVEWNSDLKTWSMDNVSDTPISVNGTTERPIAKVSVTTSNPILLRLRLTMR